MLSYFRKKMKTIITVVAVIFAATMFYGVTRGGFGGGGREDLGIGKVNGVKISPSRYRQIMTNMLGQFGQGQRIQDLAFVQYLALGQTTDFMVILSEAKRKVRISNAEVNAVIDNIVKQEELKSKEDLENALKRVGMTMSGFKKTLKEELRVQKMVKKIRDEVTLDPEDMREIKASHILLTTEADAKMVMEKIEKGEDFAALAKEHSTDPGSGAKGGDLGYFSTGRMVESFEKTAFKLKVGEVSGIVKSQFGYHIIKLTDSRLRKFEGEEKDIEKAALAQKQNQVYQKWFSELKSRAKIEITNHELKGHQLRFQGQAIQAMIEYKKAIAANPANPYLHIFLGDSFAGMGKMAEALAEYEKAVELEGGNYDLYLVLARAYERSDKKDQALEQYRKASLVAGDNKALHEELLKIFEKQKAWKDYNNEKAEVARIDKKEKFERELADGD